MALAPGSRLGSYEVVGPLGAGGMGEVYRAMDPKLSREVAIKVLPEGFAEDPVRLGRFRQEARALAALNHPNILTVFEVGDQDGVPFLVTEILCGETLRDRLTGGPLPVRRAIEVGVQVALGLGAAHEQDLLHRDIKPENLFLTREGRVKILDFGLAKLHLPAGQEAQSTLALGAPASATEPGVVLGTVGYMSPEQVQGLRLDARSDLFSLGVVLWEMVTGGRPFTGASAVETMAAILKAEPPELDPALKVPAGLARIMDSCLAKEPAARFHSAHDLAFALETLSSAGSSGGDPVLPVLAPPVRHWTPWALASGLVLAALGLGIGWQWRWRPPAQPAFHRLTFMDRRIPAARFLPNGREVLMATNVPGGSGPDLARLQLDSRELTETGVKNAALLAVGSQGQVAMALSPEVYAIGDFHGTPGISQVEAMMPHRGEGRILSADFGPMGLVVSRLQPSKRYQLELPGGQHPVDSASDFSDIRLSGDGAYLACIERPNGNDSGGCVGLLDIHRGQYRRLTGMYNNLFGLAWNGQELWFTASERSTEKSLWAVSPKGALRKVYAGPEDLTLQDIDAQGRVLLGIENCQARLYLATEGSPNSAEISAGSLPFGLGISPDGTKVLYYGTDTSTPMDYDLFLRPAQSGPPQYLGKAHGMPSFSADGTRVICLRGHPSRVSVIPLEGGEARDLPLQGLEAITPFAHLRWTPDGREVLFQAQGPKGPTQVFRQSTEGGVPQPLGLPGALVPFVAPDGHKMFTLTSQGWRVSTYPDDHPLPADLRTVPKEVVQVLGWSEDSQAILHAQMEQGGINVYRSELQGGTLARWKRFETPGVGLRSFGVPGHITPDGRHLLFTNLTWNTTLYLVEGLR